MRIHAHNGHGRILLTDEKILNVEESFNHRIDPVYPRDAQDVKKKKKCVQRVYHPASVMFWWDINYEGVTDVDFREKGVKNTTKGYQDTSLETIAESLNVKYFSGYDWTF